MRVVPEPVFWSTKTFRVIQYSRNDEGSRIVSRGHTKLIYTFSTSFLTLILFIEFFSALTFLIIFFYRRNLQSLRKRQLKVFEMKIRLILCRRVRIRTFVAWLLLTSVFLFVVSLIPELWKLQTQNAYCLVKVMYCIIINIDWGNNDKCSILINRKSLYFDLFVSLHYH